MRRKLAFATIALLGVPATAGAAAAANGGFTPETPASPNAQHILTAYYLILGFTAFIFVVVEVLLVLFIVKYRSRGRARTVEGVQVHGHTRLELTWTAIPVLILATIAAFVFSQLPAIRGAPAATDPLHITIEGHQYYWQFDYPNGSRSIDALHVPVGAVVDLRVVSADVIHSWWIPQLGGKIQALPGITNHTWFQAQRPGTYIGQCAELCGLYHENMRASVVAESPQQYRSYVTTTAKAELGRDEWAGVCAACHGALGEGGYGPALTSNVLLTQFGALDNRVRNGGVLMPAVGDTWTKTQMRALYDYVRTHIFRGAAPSGG